MADGGMTLTIDEQLAARLKAAADEAGESVEDYARHALEAYAGFEEADVAHWGESADDEIERIAQDCIDNDDAIPWDEVRAWMLGWGKPDGPPRPR